MLRGPAIAASLVVAILADIAPAFADARLKSHAYDPQEVLKIEGKLGVQATIAFGEGETIENVAVGDSAAWQITPNKRANLLFVKPLETAARTNMTVVTDRHTYFFDLVASDAASPLYMLRFTYGDTAVDAADGPVDEADPAAALAQARAADDGEAPPGGEDQDDAAPALAKVEAQSEPVETAADDTTVDAQVAYEDGALLADAVADTSEVAGGEDDTQLAAVAQPEAETATVQRDAPAAPDDTFAAAFADELSIGANAGAGSDEEASGSAEQAGALNFAWSRTGDSALLPRRVYDDGAATYLVWDAAQEMPRILTRDAQGTEGEADFDLRGQTVVIGTVPSLILLRTDDASAQLENLRSGGETDAATPQGLSAEG